MIKSDIPQMEHTIVQMYMPHLDKSMRRQIVKYCRTKNIAIYSEHLKRTLQGVEASIIRHRYTDYDSIIKLVGKERARFYIGQEDIK